MTSAVSRVVYPPPFSVSQDELAKLLEGVLDNIPGAPEGDAAAASAKANTLASYMAAAEIVGDAAAGGVPPREFDFPTASFQDLTFDMFLGSGQFGQVRCARARGCGCAGVPCVPCV